MPVALQQEYAGHGVQFHYPEDWELQEQESEAGVMISANSPGASFWSVSLQFEGPEPEHVLQEATDVFKGEYPELDSYPVEETVCHRISVGRDIEFVCLELLNTACLRAFRTGEFTVLVLYQGNDDELEETRESLEAITASLHCDGDELLFDVG